MRSLLEDRKAIISLSMAQMIPRMIFLVILLLACVLIIRLFISTRFDTNDIEADILVSSFLYGSGGVGYYDPMTARTYPQVIDVEQLDSAELDQSFYFPDNNLIAAKIELTPLSSQEGFSGKTVYFNKVWYDNFAPMLRWSVGGLGGVEEFRKDMPVIYRLPSGELKSGRIEFQVVQPR